MGDQKMEDSTSVHTNSNITAQTSGSVCAPVISGNQIQGPVTLNINYGAQEASSSSKTTWQRQGSPAAPALNEDVINRHKLNLKKKFKKMYEGTSQNRTCINDIYTELYITEGGSGEVNHEHEVRQNEKKFRRPETQNIPVKFNDLFKDISVRTVLTKGIAGIGKTISVQKFILDWAEGKANQDIHFIFPLPFRELNLMNRTELSLLNLFHYFPEVKNVGSSDYDTYKVMFIFDGLDECRLPLNFYNNFILWNISESASVDVLLTNLIKGNLLYRAIIWITTRPAAANQIPPEYVDQVTEIQGFSDLQKEEYFRQRINDPSLADRIIRHVKSSRSLYSMYHIPVFCWIAASVLERELGEADSRTIPKTQMFIHFLVYHIKHRDQKYNGKCDIEPHQTRERIMALGKLAFQQLEKGNLIFYEEDLRECGIDVKEASVYSGVCTQIFREEFDLQLGKVFSFVHLSFQVFLAALYAFTSFSSNSQKKVQEDPGFYRIYKKSSKSGFFKGAVDKVLKSKNGHLDLFFHFLQGLSRRSNQAFLRGLMTQTEISSQQGMKTVKNPFSEEIIGLLHSLNELNDNSIGECSNQQGQGLSPAPESVLLNSKDIYDLRAEFEQLKKNLYRYRKSLRINKDRCQDN